MNLAIQVGSEYLDIALEQDFFISKQIYDIEQIERRKGDFTKQIQIPNTAKNRDILEVNNTKLQKGIIANLSVNGITVANNVELFYNNLNEDFLEVRILIGNTGLFDKLRKPISDLDLSAYDFTFDSMGPNGIKSERKALFLR